ncbi:MCM DNA helicase complex subunit mcm6 [Orobanche gracilis]
MESNGGGGGGYCVDEKAVRTENIFLEFLKTFRVADDGRGGYGPYYEAEVEAMKRSESNTMFIDFSHVMRFNDVLQKAISDEFIRIEPYLRNACKRYLMELNPSFIPDDNRKTLIGVVTRTSEVRPELLQGTFKCLDCGNVIKNIEQQFNQLSV